MDFITFEQDRDYRLSLIKQAVKDEQIRKSFSSNRQLWNDLIDKLEWFVNENRIDCDISLLTDILYLMQILLSTGKVAQDLCYDLKLHFILLEHIVPFMLSNQKGINIRPVSLILYNMVFQNPSNVRMYDDILNSKSAMDALYEIISLDANVTQPIFLLFEYLGNVNVEKTQEIMLFREGNVLLGKLSLSWCAIPFDHPYSETIYISFSRLLLQLDIWYSAYKYVEENTGIGSSNTLVFIDILRSHTHDSNLIKFRKSCLKYASKLHQSYCKMFLLGLEQVEPDYDLLQTIYSTELSILTVLNELLIVGVTSEDNPETLSNCIGLLSCLDEHIKRDTTLVNISDDTREFDLKKFPFLKRELIRIVSLLVHENTKMQNLLRKEGGIPVILNQCNIDDNNPFLREAAIFCVRNLTERNPENQKLIDELQPMDQLKTI